MSVLIGHASIDENGKVSGGQAGDQTGKEVCIRSWYSKPWTVLLRPDEKYADKMASICEQLCKDDFVGYSQAYRNSLHNKAKQANYDLSKIGLCCTDCSAFMTFCAIAAGIKELEYSVNAPTTKTMKTIFAATNKFAILTDKKYLDSDKYVKRGDILVAEGKHTVMVLQNGSKAKEDTIAPDMVEKDIRTVSAINLNARIVPQGTKLFILSGGDMVNVVEEQGNWCKIEAWVSKNYLVK